MTEIELDLLHKQMIHELKKKGGKIDAIYYCADLASKNVIVESSEPKCLKML